MGAALSVGALMTTPGCGVLGPDDAEEVEIAVEE